MYLTIHPENPGGRNLSLAVDALRAGDVIIYPTDTVYGIGCSIYNTDAIQRVYQIKQQDKKKPFSFICSDLSHISEYAKVSDSAFRLMKKLIPGPYTFILPASRLRQLPKSMISKRKEVGIRVPDNKICQTLIRELGHPILNAGISDMEEGIMDDPEEIYEHYRTRVDVMINGGTGLHELSTILDLTADRPVLVRAGAGDVSTIERLSE